GFAAMFNGGYAHGVSVFMEADAIIADPQPELRRFDTFLFYLFARLREICKKASASRKKCAREKAVRCLLILQRCKTPGNQGPRRGGRNVGLALGGQVELDGSVGRGLLRNLALFSLLGQFS